MEDAQESNELSWGGPPQKSWKVLLISLQQKRGKHLHGRLKICRDKRSNPQAMIVAQSAIFIKNNC